MGMVNLEISMTSIWVLRRDDGSELPRDWRLDPEADLYPEGASILPDEEDWVGGNPPNPLTTASFRQILDGGAFRLRIRLSGNFDGTGEPVLALQVRLNGGSWSDVTTSSSIARVVPSAFVSNLTPTTDWMSTAGVFIGGYTLTTQAGAAVTWTGESNQTAHFEWCLAPWGVQGDDALEFRVLGDGLELHSYPTTFPSLVMGNDRPAAPDLVSPEAHVEVMPSEFAWSFREGLLSPDAQEGFALARHGVARPSGPWRNQTYPMEFVGNRLSPDGQYIVVCEDTQEGNGQSSTSKIPIRCYSLSTGSQLGSRSYSPQYDSFFNFYRHRTATEATMSPNSDRIVVQMSAATVVVEILSLPNLSLISHSHPFVGAGESSSHASSPNANQHASQSPRNFDDGSGLQYGLWFHGFDSYSPTSSPAYNERLVPGASSDSWGFGCTRWSGDGSLVASYQDHGLGGRKFWVFDPSTWSQVSGTPDLAGTTVSVGRNMGMNFSHDGAFLAIVFPDETRVYRTSDWGVEYTFSRFGGPLYNPMFSSDGLLVGAARDSPLGWTGVTSTEDTRLHIIDVVSGHTIRSQPFPRKGSRFAGRTGLSALTDWHLAHSTTLSNEVWLDDINEVIGLANEWWNADTGQWVADEHVNLSTQESAVVPFGDW